jgi:hypothetical protein
MTFSTKSLLGKLHEADHEVVENLINLDFTFWLFLRAEDTVSDRARKILAQFLQWQQPQIYVMEAVVGAEDASVWAVTLLPQLRLYYKGSEIERHRGVAGLSTIEKFLLLTLK